MHKVLPMERVQANNQAIWKVKTARHDDEVIKLSVQRLSSYHLTSYLLHNIPKILFHLP